MFFLTQREDNFPTTNLEALACGTPVVTYDTGGSPEVIEEALKDYGIVIGAIVKKETSQQVNLKKVIEEIRKMIALVKIPVVNKEGNDSSDNLEGESQIISLAKGKSSLREKCRSVALEYGKAKRLVQYIELYKELIS